MSGQPDTSDDLIAELARLMATNAKPEPAPAPTAASDAKPAVVSTPIRIPGSDGPIQTEAAPRIPGGESPAPAPETRPSAPVVRIPGMDMPPPGVAANAAHPETRAPAEPDPVPHAQPFAPKVVSDRATPQAPIHAVTSQPAPPPAAAADVDPIAAIIAAELDSAASAPGAGTAAGPRPAQGPIPAKFATQPDRPSTASAPAPRAMPLSLAGQGRAQPATPINLKPVHTPRAIPVESDTFGVAPTAAPARPLSVSGNDPMDEIESLIGEAVRVEMDRPAPVVTPVGGLAPRRTAPIEHKPETAPRSADEAILAAAAATGAEVERLDRGPAAEARLDADTDAEGGIVLPGARRSAGNMRQYIGMAVAGTLLLAAGFGLYWVLGMGRGGDGTVPVLTADASPVKVAPEPAATATADTVPSSPVLDELDGVTDTAGSETLVSTDQSTETDVADLGADEILDSGLANRKVRTVTVRPDGTIVSGEDAVAGSEALPDTRPNIPDLPGDVATAADVLATAAEGVAQDPIAAVIANPDAAPETAAELALVDPVTTTSAPPVSLDPTIPVPLPPMLNRPSAPMVSDSAALSTTLPALSTATTTNGQTLDLLAPDDIAATPPAAPAQTAATSAPVQSSPGNPAPAYVQLSAQRDEATAMADARRFTERFAGVIGDTALEVHIVDLGAKGTWYRVLLPASSSSAANTACANIKSAGGDCLIR